MPSSLNFYVPDFRGRTPVGIDNIGGTDAGLLSLTNALGGAGGVQTVTLDGTQVPNHGHDTTVTDPQHSHSTIVNIQHVDGVVVGGESLTSGLTTGGRRRYTDVTNTNSTGISVAVASTTGGGGLHDNMQPFMLVNYIIKT